MSADKDGKAEPAENRAKPTTTVIGVPVLATVPPDRTTAKDLSKAGAPAGGGVRADASLTTLEAGAVSAALAERVIQASHEPATTLPKGAGGAPASGPGASPSKTPSTVTPHRPTAGDTYGGIANTWSASRNGLEKPTRPGIAPHAGISPSGRSTLLLDSTVPPSGDQGGAEGTQDRPAIVVPGTSPMPPRAVTQAPPWGEGAVRMSPSIPKGAPVHREKQPSVEEISSSLILPDASGEATAASVEELSGSVLVEDRPDGRPLVSKLPAPSASPPRVSPSVKPPVPKSSRPPPAAHRALLGMPDPPDLTSAPTPNLSPSAPPPPFAPALQEPLNVPPAFPPPGQPVEMQADAAPPIAPTPPGLYPESSQITGDIELTRIPRQGLQPLLDRLREALEKLRARFPAESALRADGRPIWFLPVVAVAGLAVGAGLLAVGITFVGVIVSALHGGEETPSPASSSTSAWPSATQTSVPSPTFAAPTPPAATASPNALSACTVSGAPRVLGPSATVAAGVEVVRLGNDLGLGFASSEHDAIAIRFDPTSSAAGATTKARIRDAVRRVTPFETTKGRLSLVVDADRKGDRLQGRRTVLDDPPLQFGLSDGHIASAHAGGSPTVSLWPLNDGPAIDALRGSVANDGDRTIALAFRRGSAIWTGAATGAPNLAPKGELSHLEGLGTAVGSPAVAVSGGSVMVAWSDRPSSDEPWHLRWTQFNAGDAAPSAETFTPPPGGKGEQAMSPALTALPAGGFLLVWAEGPASGHEVRALTLSPTGQPVGAPLLISNPGLNAGQAQAAVTSSGHGVVAFLESSGTGFQLVATPITCGE